MKKQDFIVPKLMKVVDKYDYFKVIMPLAAKLKRKSIKEIQATSDKDIVALCEQLQST